MQVFFVVEHNDHMAVGRVILDAVLFWLLFVDEAVGGDEADGLFLVYFGE